MPLTYAFRLAPGPQALDEAILAEKLGYERVWSPETPAFGHDIWVHLTRLAERTQRIGIGPAVLIPSYRHPVAQASAIATLEHIAPGRLMVAFGTGFTGRIAMGQKPLSWEAMRRHLLQVRALLRGEAVDIDGGMAQLLASPNLLPDRPIRTPLLLAAQGPKGRAVAPPHQARGCRRHWRHLRHQRRRRGARAACLCPPRRLAPEVRPIVMHGSCAMTNPAGASLLPPAPASRSCPFRGTSLSQW
jgi:alkanesulfonate monooxygenase SsuD/methylene tetrahydromethanopterin reductase-like flavin-dependent oxidoreductase (luciferase family)